MQKILILGKADRVQNYITAVQGIGAEPTAGLEAEDISLFDRLIIPGGGDVDPSFYGQLNNGSKNIDTELDRLQFSVLDRFVKAGKPVLGICRGQQLVNVYFGGTLIQHLEMANKHTGPSNDDTVHDTVAAANSFLAAIYGTSFSVNSSHHQAVDRLGSGTFSCSNSMDGVIEAIMHEHYPVIGVQWHPERMAFAHRRQDTVDGRPLFEYFLSFQ